MEAYTSFARVYDTFMDNVPYKEWADYLGKILKEYGIDDGLVLDLGCGTGNMTEMLASSGYDMIGVDNAEEMLEIAMEKKVESGHDILYLLQDMREFELYGTVRAVISACDSVNYITDDEDLTEVFRLVNNYLDPEGLFVFDFNTEYKYREILGEQTIAEDREECSFIWDNYYDEDERINEYELTLFVRDEEQPQLYRKYQEEHFQRAYTLEQIRHMLTEAGLEYVTAYDDYTKESPHDRSERICKTRKRSRRKGLPYSLPIEVGRLYGLYPNVLVAIKSIILVFPARMLASRSGSLRPRPRATHHRRIAFLSRSGSPDSRGIP